MMATMPTNVNKAPSVLMPCLNVQELRVAVAKGFQPRFRFFWGHRPRADGGASDACFSQWWRCRFFVNNQRYSSAEQFMMAEKARLFGDDGIRAQIHAADDPSIAKKLGRKVRGFNENTWGRERFDLVTRGNLAKFRVDPLRGYLLATGNEILVEASPTDKIWGIGCASDDPRANDPTQWNGLNLLGFALVRVRSILRGDLQHPDVGKV